MAQIDVSDLTRDPYLAGNQFTVLRRQEVVNDFGESTKSVTTLPAVGAVYPTGDNALTRQEAYETQADTITVATQFALRGAGQDTQGNSFQPDIIFWQGNYYLVRVVNDYSKFGAGFYEAECIATNYNIVQETPE